MEKPDWLKIRFSTSEKFEKVQQIVDQHHLHTICQSGACPNMSECWRRGTATFMILGNICTRSCRFCNVKTGRPLPPDPEEPEKVARSIRLMGLSHAVITSVDRDDLPDYGAGIWAEAIRKVKELSPGTTLECLIPDFKGDTRSLDTVLKASPEIISHNMETVRRLSREIRVQARYERSLDVLKYLKENGAHRTKSGIMLGLGEEKEEVLETLRDLRQTRVDIVTIGQYLSPGSSNFPVVRYAHPEEFDFYKKEALKMGFRHVESAPLVRSSYRAEAHLL